MTKVTQIDKTLLTPIVNARSKAIELATTAEQALKEARVAELEFKVLIQQLYLEMRLDHSCRVDINSGAVTWPEETAPKAAPEVAPEAAPEVVAPVKKGRKVAK